MSSVLVVFFSKTGNVKLLAKKAVEMLGADEEELVDQTKWTNIDGFFRRARRSIIKGDTVLDAARYDPEDYEKIVLFSPYWGPNICPAIRTYLKQNKDSIREFSLVMLGAFTTDPGKVRNEVESMGFKLNGLLSLLDKGQTGKETGELQGENLSKLTEFVGQI
jgi:flavodoxin